MFIPIWVLVIIFTIILWLFLMVFSLFDRVKKLRRVIRKLENPEYEEHFDTGDVEGR